MKGGYQILDLTGATAGSPVEVKGIYKAAAGNNGKPVMILTNDGQRVYAEIAEDGDDFVTCYISAEGKTVNITIESDDSVTTVISDPGASITGLEEAVNEIAGNIGDVDDLTTTSKVVVGAVNEVNRNLSPATIGQYVDISSYGSDAYIFPSNGYILADTGNAADGKAQINLYSANDLECGKINARTNAANVPNRSMLIVFKGFKALVSVANGGSATFYPFQYPAI